MKRIKDIEYEMDVPAKELGERWVSLRIKNTSDATLQTADIKMFSMDTMAIDILESSRYIGSIEPNEEYTFYFRTLIRTSGYVYFAVDAFKNDNIFHWETPSIYMEVAPKHAELQNLYVTDKPRVILGDKIVCEATVRSIDGTDTADALTVEFWNENPVGELEEVAIKDVGELDANQSRVYKADFTPDAPGVYCVHSYLFDGARRLGYKRDYVYVANA